jgi:molecular chaperone GrpE
VTARRKGEPQEAPPPTEALPEAQPEDLPEDDGSSPAETVEHATQAEAEASDLIAPGEAEDEGTDEEHAKDTDPLAAAEQALAERTADLQRLQAEYLNYKRRVDRDRELVRENATYAALAPIVDVLDTIDRAREHGDLDEGFQAVADQLERVVSNAGLVKYGEPGDTFDPRLHEALSHIGEDPEVEVTTCKVIAKAGYRIGQRVVRAAQVLVVDPARS